MDDAQRVGLQQRSESVDVDAERIDQGNLIVRDLHEGEPREVGALAVELGVEGVARRRACGDLVEAPSSATQWAPNARAGVTKDWPLDDRATGLDPGRGAAGDVDDRLAVGRGVLGGAPADRRNDRSRRW